MKKYWFIAVAMIWLLALAPAQAKDDIHPVAGPTTIHLGSHLAMLQLPKGYFFVNKEETQALMKSHGDTVDGNELGLVAQKGNDFAIFIDYENSGYVNDKDADKLDADEILKNYQEGTENANEERKKNGFAEIHVSGWAEKPKYDASKHIVTWALIGSSTNGDSVNYFTRLLGRHGVLSLNLVTSKSQFEADRTKVSPLLAQATYVAGERYEEFQPGKDKDSGMGLTGLILAGGGIALAAKLGLFAKLGKLIIVILLYAKKLIIVAVVGVAGWFKKKKGGNDEPPAA